MPHSITFDATRKQVTILVTPPISMQGALTAFREVRTDPRFSAAYGVLLNSLAADRPPTIDEGQRMATVLRAFFPGQKFAWVRHNPPRNPGIETLVATAGPRVQIRNFSEVAEAEAWLAG